MTVKLELRIETVAFDNLRDRVHAALLAGRFNLESTTETVGTENGFAVLRVTARRVVIDLDEPSRPAEPVPFPPPPPPYFRAPRPGEDGFEG